MIRSAPIPLPADEEPLVSIVVPVYNGEAFLADALESALGQRYRNLEVVVADNRSTDRSAEIADGYARRDPRVRVERAAAHVGIRANWNRAVRLVSPESRYVKVLSADDVLLPECISRQAACAASDPRIALVGGYRFDGDRLDCGGLPLTTGVAPGREIARRMLLGGSDLFGAPPNVLYRADLVRDRPELFALPFFNFDDGACMDLLEAGDFGFVHEVVSWSRTHPGQQTATVDRLRQWETGSLVLVARFGRRFLSRHELRRSVRSCLARYLFMLAKQAVKGRPWRDEDFRSHHAEALRRISAELRASGLGSEAAVSAVAAGALSRVGARGPAESSWAFR